MPPLSTSTGKPTGAVKGVTNMLMNLKKEVKDHQSLLFLMPKVKILDIQFMRNINQIGPQCLMI
jgi:5'-3' exonuclease